VGRSFDGLKSYTVPSLRMQCAKKAVGEMRTLKVLLELKQAPLLEEI